METPSIYAHLNSKDTDHKAVACSDESPISPVKISSSMDIVPKNQSINDHQPVAPPEVSQPANLLEISSSTHAILGNEASVSRVSVSYLFNRSQLIVV